MYSFFNAKACVFGLLLGTLLLTSCETDIDLLSDEGDVAVVYGLLDPDQETQYIKINKTFVGQESAEVMAQNPDNFNYPEGSLDVMLEAYKGSTLKQTLVAQRTENNPKSGNGNDGQPGIFSTANNVLYTFNTEGTNALDKDTAVTYKLIINNKLTGERVTSETQLVSDFRWGLVTQPVSILSFALGDLKFANGRGGFKDYIFEWTTVRHAKRYELDMVLRYREVDTDTSDYFTYEFPVGVAITSSTQGRQKLSITYDGESFYRRLNEYFSRQPAKKRLVESIDLRFTVGGDEINTYVLVGQPSLGIVQERPEYTNIDNGLGIFSTRRVFYFPGYLLDASSVDELIAGKYTLGSGLSFCQRQKNTSPVSYECN
jgi:hypothetical protein